MQPVLQHRSWYTVIVANLSAWQRPCPSASIAQHDRVYSSNPTTCCQTSLCHGCKPWVQALKWGQSVQTHSKVFGFQWHITKQCPTSKQRVQGALQSTAARGKWDGMLVSMVTLSKERCFTSKTHLEHTMCTASEVLVTTCTCGFYHSMQHSTCWRLRCQKAATEYGWWWLPSFCLCMMAAVSHPWHICMVTAATPMCCLVKQECFQWDRQVARLLLRMQHQDWYHARLLASNTRMTTWWRLIHMSWSSY